MRSWSAPGSIWEGFGRLPGVSWAALGLSWAALGRSWAPLGRLWGACLVLLGASWLPNAAQNELGLDFSSILRRLGTCRADFSRASGACFGTPFAAPRASLHNAFINAVSTLLHLPALFHLSIWCGGLCAAHGIFLKRIRKRR